MRTLMSVATPLDVTTIRADFPILARTVHRQRRLVYFDNAATSQRPRQVIDAIVRCYEVGYGNVHRSTHALGDEATAAYESTRTRLARFVGAAAAHEIIFTSGTTAAINLVARAWGDANVRAGDEIVLTIMEHHSNIVPWQQLAERSGARVRFVPLTDDGLLDLDALDRLLNERTRVVAVTALSNVLGTRNPVGEIVRRARRVGAKVLVDAAQHVPHEPLDIRQWSADWVAISAHKMLGPSGIGALYGREEILAAMPPFLGGGSMISEVTTEGFTPGWLPAKFEAGTPPIAASIGWAAALDYLADVGLDRIAAHEHTLATAAHEQLGGIEGLRFLGPGPDHKAGIVSFVVDGANVQDIAVLLDQRGIAVRPGHHCAMPLHKALGVDYSCRASFYLYNTLDEVACLAEALAEIVPRLRR
jgi:cysteine desulfurase/selenocysteine lyase